MHAEEEADAQVDLPSASSMTVLEQNDDQKVKEMAGNEGSVTTVQNSVFTQC